MKFIEVKSPAALGLSILVCSGPRGSVRDDWPCIEYTVQIQDDRRRPVWTGEFRLGIGHVKPLSYDAQKKIEFTASYRRANLSAEQENTSHHWARGATFKKDERNNRLLSELAAKLAVLQGVTPKLDDVCHSLLCDGAAFFDGQRFEDWCSDLGYSDDSMKAKETFDTCDRIGRDLARAFSRDDLESLREWASNY